MIIKSDPVAFFWQTAPFVMSKTLEDGSVSYEGYCIDLLNELASNLKFTYEIYPTPDGMYGAETENGTWNGMIGELLNEVCKYFVCFVFVVVLSSVTHLLIIRYTYICCFFENWNNENMIKTIVWYNL